MFCCRMAARRDGGFLVEDDGLLQALQDSDFEYDDVDADPDFIPVEHREPDDSSDEYQEIQNDTDIPFHIIDQSIEPNIADVPVDLEQNISFHVDDDHNAIIDNENVDDPITNNEDDESLIEQGDATDDE